MLAYIFNCSYCNYKSNKKFNLNRHMMSKHKNLNMVNDNLNMVNDNLNVVNDNLNVVNDNLNVVNDNLNVVNDKQCHLCHKILSDRSSKSKHLKICKGKEISNELIIIEKNNNNKLILNETENSHQITNITNNINLVSYNSEDRKINFDVSLFYKDNFYTL